MDNHLIDKVVLTVKKVIGVMEVVAATITKCSIINFRKRTILFSFLIGISLTACDKKNETNDDERLTFIKIGDQAGMNINMYDTTLSPGRNKSNYYSFDLDNNGIDDIQFELAALESPAVGSHPKIWVKSLNNHTKFCGYFTQDTLYLNRDTSLVRVDENNMFEKIVLHKYSCNRISDDDSILNINPNFRISPFESNQYIKADDTFNSDTLILTDDEYIYPVKMPLGYSGDTIVYRMDYYSNDCYSFPLEKIQFIGLTLNENRLGWIKIKNLMDSQYKLIFYSSAIQK